MTALRGPAFAAQRDLVLGVATRQVRAAQCAPTTCPIEQALLTNNNSAVSTYHDSDTSSRGIYGRVTRLELFCLA